MMIDSTNALMAQAQASAQYGSQNNVSNRASQLTDGHIKTEAQARKAGQEFESMFLGQMLSHMFAGGIGIADAVTREILKVQEG